MENYNVEFILLGKDIEIEKLTKTLNEVGSSVTINREGDNGLKICICAPDPKKVFDRTSRFGKPAHIKVNEAGQ